METCSKDPSSSSAEPEEEVLSTAQFIEAFGYPFKLVSPAPWGGMQARVIANVAGVEPAIRLAAHENKVNKANFYFEPNESRVGHRQKSGDADIVYLRSVKADIDAKDGRTLEDCLAIVDGLPVEPSIVVFSGGGYQPHYLLQGKVDTSQVELYKAVGLRLRELASNGDNVSACDSLGS